MEILTARLATGREQHLEVMLAVLAALELVEDAVGERLEALGTDEAVRVPQLAGRVDDLLGGVEPELTPFTDRFSERHRFPVGRHGGRW